MSSATEFYSSGYGDRLVDPSKYPGEIIDYLKAEEELLTALVDQFDLLIEVGCMDGRYLEWTIRRNKRYLGVDIVERYVRNGQGRLLSLGLPLDRYRIEICDAAAVHETPYRKGWLNKKDKVLIMFPFNSFGNIDEPKAVLRGLSRLKKPFLICSYTTSDFANLVRLRYYSNCGYKQIRCVSDNVGVRFVSNDGLDTVAYNPAYLEQLCEESGITVSIIPLSSIGACYTPKDLKIKRFPGNNLGLST